MSEPDLICAALGIVLDLLNHCTQPSAKDVNSELADKKLPLLNQA